MTYSTMLRKSVIGVSDFRDISYLSHKLRVRSIFLRRFMLFFVLTFSSDFFTQEMMDQEQASGLCALLVSVCYDTFSTFHWSARSVLNLLKPVLKRMSVERKLHVFCSVLVPIQVDVNKFSW